MAWAVLIWCAGVWRYLVTSKFSSTLFCENNFMKILQNKIANIKIITDDNCSDFEREIIQLYWKLNSKYLFTETVKNIKSTYDLTNSELDKLVSTKSTFNANVFCRTCKTVKLNQFKNRSSFAKVLRILKSKETTFKCNQCTEAQMKVKENETSIREIKEKEYQVIVFAKAIEEENWLKLNKFCQAVLKSCIDFNDFENLKKYYKQRLSESNYPNLFDALKQLELESLVKLSYSDNEYISDYWLHPNIYDLDFKMTSSDSNKNNPIVDEFNQISHKKELKFRLTVNDISNLPNKPKFAGTIKFPKSIILNTDIKYTFGMWHRENDQMYLTIIPTDNIVNSPIQKNLSEEPKHIQEAINNYFSQVAKNLNRK